MEWLIGFFLLIVGIVIGFFVARFITVKDSVTEPALSENTSKEIMAQHADSHVRESKRIVQLLEKQTLALNQQIEAFEQAIIADPSSTKDSDMNYFGEHASLYLRNKSAKQTRTKSTADIQPLDFSSHSSGLFSGDSSPKVTSKE